MLQNLEKKIIGKMAAIKRGDLAPKDSGIGKLFSMLKGIDEPSYLEHLEKYKQILSA